MTTDTNNDRTDFVVNQRAGDLVYQGFRDFFVWKFRGIRFAAKPERFEYARPYEPTPEERTAPIPALFALPEGSRDEHQPHALQSEARFNWEVD
ncbi:hypothetical protein MCOR25_011239 [Pyricularia grisea]|nr:hypothetical protein MCOR25_011239 [Pyricularia grisea]